MAEQRTNTAENPINPNIKSEVLLVNTFKSKVFATTNPMNQIAITEIVITIVQVVRFASFILFLDFMFYFVLIVGNV